MTTTTRMLLLMMEHAPGSLVDRVRNEEACVSVAQASRSQFKTLVLVMGANLVGELLSVWTNGSLSKSFSCHNRSRAVARNQSSKHKEKK